ncbi:hypothetical protein EJ04DRAFT_582036 [Polyplosphaeria fusca]|uniref:Uncharacterized protein n=1 Tax=Polyplosphaeria fusca TaxID=682080 RepID=A0A9P4QM85_9PLEO|nr:hypothetical protein EJ04DRAFT_582036 [Polyplosphaeria fusca]
MTSPQKVPNQPHTMTSPQKPHGDPLPGVHLFSRPFARRSSSSQHSETTELQRQLADLQSQLQHQSQQADAAKARAHQAEQREKEIRDLAQRFWKEEWSAKSGMRDYMLACSEKRYVDDIEERILHEYGGLFKGGDGGSG